MMDGTWLPVDAELSGQRLLEGSLNNLQLLLSSANHELKVNGRTVNRGMM